MLLIIETFAVSLFLALIHLPVHRFDYLIEKKRAQWLSFAGGVAVAYVFGRLLPELSEWQSLIDVMEHPFYKTKTFLQFFNYEIYIVSLIGLVVFYGLHCLAYWRGTDKKNTNPEAGKNIFWLYVVCYSFYNALIGYLMIHHHRMGFLAIVIIAVAMGFHLVANAYHIRERSRVLFDKFGKWILSASVLAGWLIGIFSHLPDEVYITLFAFLLGGIVMNAIQEELPKKRESYFWAFFIGVITFTLLLLVFYNIPIPEEIMEIHG